MDNLKRDDYGLIYAKKQQDKIFFNDGTKREKKWKF